MVGYEDEMRDGEWDEDSEEEDEETLDVVGVVVGGASSMANAGRGRIRKIG